MNKTTITLITTLYFILLLSYCDLFVAKKVHRKLMDEDGDLLEGDVVTNSATSQQKMKMSFGQMKGPPVDEELTPEKMKNYKEEERNLRIQLALAKEQYGRISTKYANILHQLGRVIYKQERYEEVLQTAREIVKIHEELDGPESVNTAKALTNVGSTANRLGKLKECDLAMNRALYIFIKEFGADSREVLIHRGQMLTFHIPFAKTSTGLSYDDYKFEL